MSATQKDIEYGLINIKNYNTEIILAL